MDGQQDSLNIIHSIALKAFNLVHADLIVIFPYDQNQGWAVPIFCGNLLGHSAYSAETTIDGSVRDLILTAGNLYLKDDSEHSKLLKKIGIAKQHQNSSAKDFWHHEKIKSSGLLRLEYEAEAVGVMSINYRSNRNFGPRTKEVMEFAAQFVAHAIVHDRLIAENQIFWEKSRSDSLALSVSEIITSLAHNSGHLLNTINMQFGRLQVYLKRSAGQRLERERVESLVDGMIGPLNNLANDFARLKEYRRPDVVNFERCDINELIRKSVHLLRARFERQRIAVVERLASNLPSVRCDRGQIQHVMVNLFLNAVEAMKTNGKLSVYTELSRDGNSVRIGIVDTGTGVPSQIRHEIFQPFFSTKKHAAGSGLGLTISQHIVRSNGGTIELGPSSPKGATFVISLPVDR